MKTQGIVGGVGPGSTVDYYRSRFQIWREETMGRRRRGKTFFGYVIKVGVLNFAGARGETHGHNTNCN